MFQSLQDTVLILSYLEPLFVVISHDLDSEILLSLLVHTLVDRRTITLSYLFALFIRLFKLVPEEAFLPFKCRDTFSIQFSHTVEGVSIF